jgi:hypothetical protein
MRCLQIRLHEQFYPQIFNGCQAFELTEHTLTESQEEDLNSQVEAKIAPKHAVREQELFLQQIASCNDMLESLI